MKVLTLSAIVQTFFPGQSEKKHVTVQMRDRWILYGKLGVLLCWYPSPVELVETESYIIFDRRDANRKKALIYGVGIFVLISLLTILFFGYFSFMFVVFSFFTGILVSAGLFLAGGSLKYGIVVIDKQWIESVFDQKGWVVLWGRKTYDECKSLLCHVHGAQYESISYLDRMLQSTDFEQVYELFGVHERFEVKYRGVK